MKNFKFKWLLLSFILSVASISQVCADETYDGNQWIYFNVQDNNWKWTDSSAKLFAVFKKTGQADTWTGQLAQVIGDVYGAKIPAGTYTTVDFVRQSSGGNEWNRISNKTLTSGKNYWYANGTEWGDAELYYYLSDNTFYFDNSVTQWVTPYFRIGRTNYADNIAMTQVAGTAYLWSYTRDANWENYHAIAITNASGASSNIYTVSPATKSSTNIKENITSDSYAKCTAVDDGTYYTTTFQSSLPSYTISYSKAGTGTGTLSVTKYNGSTYDEFTSGDPVYPTQIMKIIATPDEGNALTSLSISGATQIGSTDTYYVTSNTTISATFTPEETHTVRILYKDYSSGDVIADYREIFNVGVTTITSISPKDIEGYEFREWTCGTHVKNNDAATDEDIDINTKTCSSDCDFTITAQYDKLTRLAFTNPWNWTNIYAYVWDGTGNNGWTSTQIKGGEKDYTTTINCKTVYYFEFNPNTRAWTNIIFHDGTSPGTAGSTKTDDLTIEGNDDKYYDGSQWTGTLMDYTVSVATEASYKGTVSGGGTARSEGCSATISAEPKPGYRFDSWTSENAVTFDNANSATTDVWASEDATVTANFTQDGIIYFDNTMSQWQGDIYVYLFTNSSTNPWWTNKDNNNGPGIVFKRADNGDVLYDYYGKMTRIGESNIYFFDYKAAGCTSTIYKVVFTKGDYHTSSGLYQTSAAYLMEFPTCFPMYIASQNWSTTNSTGYHSTGYWKRYNVTTSGFDIRGLNGDWNTHYQFESLEPESNTFKATVHLDQNTHSFKIYRCSGDPLGNNGTMQPNNSSGWEMTTGTNDCQIYAPAGGDYVFTLNLGSDHILLSVEYPLLNDDYHLLYTGRISKSDETTHYHPSRSIRHITEASTTQKDTICFWIDKDNKGTINLQYCTNASANSGTGSWANVTSGGTPVTVNLSSINKTGFYNFEIKQVTDDSTPTPSRTVTVTLLGEYSGDFYIRSRAADGAWEAYKKVDNNKMQYSDYAKAHSGYDYYHVHWCSTGTNVKFTIANDYSPSLTDSLEEDSYVPSTSLLPYQASVRSMWNSETNEISRAYINGSSEGIANYLYIKAKKGTSGAEGAKNDSIKKANGTTITPDGDGFLIVKFDDNNNWVYSTDIQAVEGTHVRLISDYYYSSTHHYQCFKGSEEGSWDGSTTAQIIGGNSGAYQTLRLVYDFKTNHMLSAWLATGSDISTATPIYADVIVMRDEQKDATQITFSSTGNLTQVETVYGVMRFNKWSLNNRKRDNSADSIRSNYDRDLYWISFPFDVKLNDVFGFGDYGTHWIIEYYDGKGRAEHGFWADSPSNWKFVTPAMRDDFKLEANVGYILALDLDELTTSSAVWKNNVTDVYLYFPSSTKVGNITKTESIVRINQTGYQCTIGPRFDGGDDRTIKDSYWHCIGVPSFANTTHGTNTGWTTGEGTIGTVDAGDYPSRTDWTSKDLPYLYEWVSSDNTLRPVNSGSATFKAMYSYLVQYNKDTIKWMQVTTPTAAAVVARIAETPDREYKLVLRSEERTEDQTFVRLTDDASVSNRFEFNYDLSKEYNAGRGNIWTVTADTVEVAGNSMPKPVQTTVVPVGVKVVTNGEYTLAMPEGTNGEDVYLIDNAYGTRTNLGLMPYTVTLTAGTYEGRFALEFAPIQDSPTSLENDGLSRSDELNDAIDTVRKVFVGGRLYILRDGKVYDAAGQRIE